MRGRCSVAGRGSLGVLLLGPAAHLGGVPGLQAVGAGLVEFLALAPALGPLLTGSRNAGRNLSFDVARRLAHHVCAMSTNRE